MAELHRASPCKLERDIENAAFSALTQWIEHDRPPPHAPVIQVDMTTAPRSIVRDALGNAVGGAHALRRRADRDLLPDRHAAHTTQFSGFSVLYGYNTPFDDARLDSLYRNHGQ